MLTFLSFLIAILAAFTTFLCARYQVITMVNAQLADKARECNKNLDDSNQIPLKADKVSGLVWAIITARQLLNYQLKFKQWHILFLLNRQSIVDQFYLQLHTSIRVWIEKEHLPPSEIKTNDSLQDGESIAVNESIKRTILSQFQEVREFLKESISRNQDGYYNRL